MELLKVGGYLQMSMDNETIQLGLISDESLLFAISLKNRNHTTKCRVCENYRRIKKGDWNIPDWKSNAAICIHPEFQSCDYRYNLIGRRNFFKLKQSEINLNIIDIINDHQNFIAEWRNKSISLRLKIEGVR